MHYNFDWNPNKAKKNKRKHKISFERATTIFRDPNAVSIADEEHSKDEDRWITMAIDNNGVLLVVSHTFTIIDKSTCEIRIISARKAEKPEIHQYQIGWTMKKQYDFSKGERGKFYNPTAQFNLPIYLEPEMAEFISEIADKQHTDMNNIVNSLLQKNKELIDSMKLNNQANA